MKKRWRPIESVRWSRIFSTTNSFSDSEEEDDDDDEEEDELESELEPELESSSSCVVIRDANWRAKLRGSNVPRAIASPLLSRRTLYVGYCFGMTLYPGPGNDNSVACEHRPESGPE